MQKRILITGAHGFIGRHLAQAYKRNGYFVTGMGYGVWSQREQNWYGVDVWYDCAVNLDNLILYANNPDIIIHCAGGSSVGFSINNPEIDFEKTVVSLEAVLEYIRKYSPNVKLIYPSSAAVYGNANNYPTKEEATLAPISPYGVHKKISEDLCLLYSNQYKLLVVVLRLFSIYGEGLKKQLLWDACNKLSNGENVFWGTGDELRDWLHIDDAVNAVLTVEKQLTNNQIEFINVGSGNSTSVKTVVDEIALELLGNSGRALFNKIADKGNPQCFKADINKLSNLGWEPQVDLIEGIKRYVDWYKIDGTKD